VSGSDPPPQPASASTAPAVTTPAANLRNNTVGEYRRWIADGWLAC
jgi:hypothetical protein